MKPSLTGQCLGWAVAFLGLAAFFSFAFLQLDYAWNWEGVWEYRQKFLNGWITTVWISAAALFLSAVLGFGVALARSSPVYILRSLSTVYVELIRGTPFLVQILIFFYIVADGYGISNRYMVGVLALSLFSGAYIAEIFRAGIENVSASQRESARAVGFTRWQTLRFVILPQAIRQTLPPLSGQFASLIKDSSLLSIIAVNELTLNAQEVNSFTFSAFESFLPLACGYLILTLPISLFSRRMEERLKHPS
ncbi:amino acid ABC transporter permease [Puniceicoccus vermicola]|uniref:amino acid ABC transporter permease n=1 Tax=Puniceicoccus vermicola TaxID=388746 RepID=UPI001C8B1DD2